MDGFESSGNIPNFAGTDAIHGFHTRRKNTDLHRTQVGIGGEHAQRIVRFDHAFEHADISDNAFIRIVMCVEDERAQGRFVRIFRGGNAFHDGFEDRLHVDAFLGGNAQNRIGIDPEQRADIFSHLVGTGRGEVNFIDNGDNFEVRFERLVEVCKCLRFNALRGIHHQNRAFAGFERAADLVAEVHMTGRIDQV